MCYYRLRKMLLRRIVTQLISVLIFNVTTATSIVTQHMCSCLEENVLQPRLVVTHIKCSCI
jgi:hypothetical protein